MKTRAQKEQAVESFKEKINRSKSVVFTDYKGLNMSQISDLRKKLRAEGAEFTVTKNTLLQRSLKDAGKPEPSADVFEGPIATLFSYEDEVSPIKVLVKALKDAQIGKIKGGIVNNNLFDTFSITRLAGLPSKLELRGQVVGTLAAPLQGIVGVLQANLRNLVYALDQIRISKGGDKI